MTKPISRKMAVDALLYRFQKEGIYEPHGETCYILCPECHDPIMPGQDIQFDHTHGHAMGGPHEYQNLRPIHYDPCHKRKSARDVAALAKVKRIQRGKKTSKRPMVSGTKFPPKGTVKFPRRKPA